MSLARTHGSALPCGRDLDALFASGLAGVLDGIAADIAGRHIGA
ncbi:hypothetical protein [Streptomyces sp. NBC_00046]